MSVSEAVFAIIRCSEIHSEPILAVWNRQHQTWGLPGGKVEAGDQGWPDALARELKEETGLFVSRYSLVRSVNYDDPIAKAVRTIHLFEVRVTGDPLAFQGTRWIDRDRLICDSAFGDFYRRFLPERRDPRIFDVVTPPTPSADSRLQATHRAFVSARMRAEAAEIKERVMREHFDTVRKELGLAADLADVAVLSELQRVLEALRACSIDRVHDVLQKLWAVKIEDTEVLAETIVEECRKRGKEIIDLRHLINDINHRISDQPGPGGGVGPWSGMIEQSPLERLDRFLEYVTHLLP